MGLAKSTLLCLFNLTCKRNTFFNCKFNSLDAFWFLISYLCFLVDNNSVPSGCVIISSLTWQYFFCFSFHSSYFQQVIFVKSEFSKTQAITKILVAAMLTNHDNVLWPLFDHVEAYTKSLGSDTIFIRKDDFCI